VMKRRVEFRQEEYLPKRGALC